MARQAISGVIKELRLQKLKWAFYGLVKWKTSKEFCDFCDINPSVFSVALTGRRAPSVVVLEKISKLFYFDPSWHQDNNKVVESNIIIPKGSPMFSVFCLLVTMDEHTLERVALLIRHLGSTVSHEPAPK